jgi:AcrR family transcriptional regulator
MVKSRNREKTNMREAKNSTSRIMLGTIKATCKYGIENLTTKLIAKESEMTDGNIYNFFSSKNELLKQCFLMISNEIAKVFTDFNLSDDQSCEQALAGMCQNVIGYFMKTPKKALFFFAYRNTKAFNDCSKTRDVTWLDSFFDKLTEKYSEISNMNSEERNMAKEYAINATLMCAKLMADGTLPKTPEGIESSIAMVLKGITGRF